MSGNLSVFERKYAGIAQETARFSGDGADNAGIAQETARFSGDGADNAGYAASSAAGASVAATAGEQKTEWSRAAATGAGGAVETEADTGPDAATKEATRAATSATADTGPDAATRAATRAATGATAGIVRAQTAEKAGDAVNSKTEAAEKDVDAAAGAGVAAAGEQATERSRAASGKAGASDAKTYVQTDAVADAVAARQRKIKKEKTRLSKQFKELEARSRAVADGLIEQAAFMRVQLQELAEDLTAHGVTELFSQGNQEPYERQRPSANIYASMNANYQKIIKQLNELLPKTATKTPVGDGFVDFINGREDL